MDLHELFEKHLQKIDSLNDFIVLYGKKPEEILDLRDIANECEDIKELLLSCRELLKKFQDENMTKCRDIIGKSQHQQLIMLHVLEQVIDCDADQTFGHNDNECKSPYPSRHVEQPVSVLKEISNTMTPNKFTPFKPGEQPTMTYADYIKSPYATKRMRPLALQFTDFERTISANEFAKLPGYVADANNFLTIKQLMDKSDSK